MAELYFKVHSDWEEVVKLRTEIVRLENQLNQFNGKAPLDVLDKMCNELVVAKTRLQSLVDDAAIAGSKMEEAFKKGTSIDLSTPEGQLKAFDATAEKFFNNFVGNLSDLQERVKGLTEALNASGTALANIRVTEQNAAEIENLKKQNQDLQAELARQSEELQKQILLYQQLQTSIVGNNNARQSSDGLIQQEINTTNAQVVSQGEVTDAVETTTQALHDQADAAENVKQKMSEIESPDLGDGENGFYTQTLERDIEIAKEKIEELRNKMGELDSTDAEGIAAIESRIAAYQSEINEKTAKLEEIHTGIRATNDDVSNLTDSILHTFTVIADGATQAMTVYAESQDKAQALADRIQISFENIPSMVQQASDAIASLKGFDNLSASEQQAIHNAERLLERVKAIGSAQDMLSQGYANKNFADVEGLEDSVDKMNDMIRLKQENVELAKQEEEAAKNVAAAHGSIRTQIMNARNEMVQLIAAGQMGTPEFRAAAEHAGELRKQMALANAYMQYFANPNRNLAGLKTTLQGAAGSMSLLTGIMGVFNTKSEQMAAIQTKIQSIIGVIVGLEQVYNTIKQTSTARIWLEEVATKALAAARGTETATTAESTAAQVASNVVRSQTVAAAGANTTAIAGETAAIVAEEGAAVAGTVANITLAGAFRAVGAAIKSIPVFGWIVAGISAIIGVVSLFSSKASEARKKANEMQKALSDAAAEPITKYHALREEFNRVSGNINSLNRFVKNHANEFKQLGFNINSAADAERVFNAKTDDAIKALSARAKAAATASLAVDTYKKILEKEITGNYDEEYNQLKDQYERILGMQQQFNMESQRLFAGLAGAPANGLAGATEQLTGEFGAMIEAYRTEAGKGIDEALEYLSQRQKGLKPVTTKKVPTRDEYSDYVHQQSQNLRFMFEQQYGHAPQNNTQDRQAWDALVASQNIQNEKDWRREHTITTTEYVKEARSVDELTASISALQSAYSAARTDADRLRIGQALLQEQANLAKMNKPINTGGGGRSADEIMLAQLQANQETAQRMRENLLLQQQAQIDMMPDGIDKEIEQMKLNHKKRMAELDAEQEELLQKKREAEGTDAQGNIRNGFYTSGQYQNVALSDKEMLGVNSQRISENKAYFDNLSAIFKNIEGGTEASMRKMEILESAYGEVVKALTDMGDSETANKFIEEAERLYRESMLEINRERLSNLYDYLREFGTVQQQMYAIEKSYDDKIAKEQDPSKKAMLERQKQSQLSSVNAQNLAMGIDWSTAFEGVGNLLGDVAKETLKKVEEYMQTAEFKKLDAKDKKSYTDLRSELRKETGGNSTSAFNFSIWGDISKNVKDYQDSIKKLKAAQEAHNAAVQDLRDAERDMETALKSGSKKQIEAAQAVLDAANDAVNVTADDQTDAQEKSEEAKKKLAENTEKAANGIQNFVNYVNEMANGSLYGFANGISKLVTSLAKGSDGVGKSLNELGGKVGGIIGAILQIIDALGDDPTKFIEDLLDKIATVIEKVLEDLPQIIGSVLEGVGNIVGGVVQGVGNLFGADLSGIFGGGTENFDAAVEKWGWLLDTWKDNLEYEKSLMKEAYGTKVTDIQQKTEADLRRTQQAAAEIYRGWAGDGAGWFSHSNGYNANEDANWRYLWDYDKELAKRMGVREYSIFGNTYLDNGSIENLFNLTAKELKELKYNNSQFWQSLHGEAQKYLDQIIEAEEEIEQLRKEAMEQLTATSFDTLVSDFQSALANMDSDAEDFADNFEKYMQNAVLSALVAEKYKPAIEQWYKMFAAMMEDGMLTEQETEQLHNGGYFTNPTTGEQEYSQGWDDISASGLRDRDALKNQFNWGDDSSKQEADKKGFAAMSQDTGEELNGRFTAVQIAGENVSAQMNVAVPILTGIGVSASRTADMVEGIGRVADDMLTNIVECYSELNMIRTTTDEMLPIMKENKKTLEKIEKNTKNI